MALLSLVSAITYLYVMAFGLPDLESDLKRILLYVEVVFAMEFFLNFFIETKSDQYLEQAVSFGWIARDYIWKGFFWLDILSLLPL